MIRFNEDPQRKKVWIRGEPKYSVGTPLDQNFGETCCNNTK